MKQFYFPLFISFSFLAAGQKPTLQFDKQFYDFGAVQQWNNPVAAFIFTNAGDKDALFLPTYPQDDIFIELPKGKIAAGSTDTVFVYYFTDKQGEFQKDVELYTGNSDLPIRLSVKGNILSLDEKAYISCPGFAPKTERVDELALLLDSLSGNVVQPVTEQQKAEVMVFEEAETPETQAEPVPDEQGLLPQNLYSPNNIIFLIDVSSSMKKPDKLPLLKISMKNLTGVLRKTDYLSVVVYSTTSTVLLQPTAANRKEEINLLIDTLRAKGITNGGKGLQTAYEIAEQNFISGGNNQVIIATDGLFNSPGFSESAIFSLVRGKAADNIILSVVGFGDDKDALRMLKKMADKGNGNFIQIPDKPAADEALIDEIKFQSAVVK